MKLTLKKDADVRERVRVSEATEFPGYFFLLYFGCATQQQDADIVGMDDG